MTRHSLPNRRPDRGEPGDGTTVPETTDEGSPDATIEQLIDQMIQSHVADLEAELAEVERQVEEIDNFARISLNERKIKQSEANLVEFSDSLTNFAEKAFNNINALEERLDVQALLLAAVVEALNEEGIDLDVEQVERYQQESVVTDMTPEERLERAIEES